MSGETFLQASGSIGGTQTDSQSPPLYWSWPFFDQDNGWGFRLQITWGFEKCYSVEWEGKELGIGLMQEDTEKHLEELNEVNLV